jgi:hypothetical protein
MMPAIDQRDRAKFSSAVRAGRSGRVARHRHHLGWVSIMPDSRHTGPRTDPSHPGRASRDRPPTARPRLQSRSPFTAIYAAISVSITQEQIEQIGARGLARGARVVPIPPTTASRHLAPLLNALRGNRLDGRTRRWVARSDRPGIGGPAATSGGRRRRRAPRRRRRPGGAPQARRRRRTGVGAHTPPEAAGGRRERCGIRQARAVGEWGGGNGRPLPTLGRGRQDT